MITPLKYARQKLPFSDPVVICLHLEDKFIPTIFEMWKAG